MEHFEKKLSSTVLYEGKVVHLRRDTVELENGGTATREVIDHPGGVAVFALDDDNNLLMVRQFRYPFGQTLLELPAGKLEPGEAPSVCGRRELMEECGCRAEIFAPLCKLYPTCAYDSEVIHIFFAAGLTAGSQKLDPDEFLTVERIPVEKVVLMVLNGEIPDGKTQLGVLTWHALHQQGRI